MSNDPKENQTISQPHDGVWKKGMRNVQVARDLFEHYLPEKIQALVDLSTLELKSSSYIDDHYRQYCSDVLYGVQTKQGDGYLYCLAEHQSRADPRMALRMWTYTLRVIEDHLEQGHKHYPLVIPLLYFNGNQTPYPYSSDLLDYFSNPEEARRVMFKPFRVIDVHQLSDAQLLKHRWSAFLELVLKYMKTQQDFLGVLHDLVEKQHVQFLLNHEGRQYVVDMLHLAMKKMEIHDKRAFVELAESASPDLGEQVMSLLQMEHQQGREEGLELGLLKGRVEGRVEGEKIGVQKGKYDVVRAMKKLERWSVKEIAAATGLPQDEVEPL